MEKRGWEQGGEEEGREGKESTNQVEAAFVSLLVLSKEGPLEHDLLGLAFA